MGSRRRSLWGVGTAAAALALTGVLSGCGSSGTTQAGTDGSSGPAAGSGSGAGRTISVVASTDVWGDVARQVAGRLAGGTVEVTSIITDPAADPHSYEANTQNLLALSKADVVIENGGGYDDFVDDMLRTANNPSAKVLDAVSISGKTTPPGGSLNEHVWYDLPTVRAVASRIVAALSAADPSDASTYRGNAAAFDRHLSGLEHIEGRIKRADDGEGVAITEPVPLYMLQACGLVNQTPADFSEGVEEGTDVSPAVLKQTEDLFTSHRVKLLAYNEQTSGPETEAVLRAARDSGIPVVPVTETLPSGQDYITWMRTNLDAIDSALG